MVLPVIERELRMRARSGMLAYTRMGAAAVFIVVGGPMVLMMTSMGARAGTMLFESMGWLLMLFALFEGARISAGTISEERREGTLGLLFLTDLSALDVLLGKLAGAALTAVFALLAMVPVLSVAVLMGGVTAGEVVRGAATLGTSLVLSLAAGLWASARCREWLVSILVALGTVVAMTMGPLVVELVIRLILSETVTGDEATAGLLSPVVTLAMVPDGVYAAVRGRFWAGLGLQVGMALVLVWAAAARLRGAWREELSPATGRKEGKEIRERAAAAGVVEGGEAAGSAAKRRRWLDGELWPWGASAEAVVRGALARRLRLRFWTRVLVGMAVLGHLPEIMAPWWNEVGGGGTRFAMSVLMGLVMLPAMVCGFGVALGLVYLAVRAMGEARQAGELELLLTTPLGPAEFLGHAWHGLRRVAMLLTAVNAGTTCVGLLAALAVTPAMGMGGGGPGFGSWASHVLHGSVGIAGNWLTYGALIWTGFWFSLRFRRLPVAVGLTFGLVGFLTPAVVSGISMLLLAGYQPGLGGDTGVREVVGALAVLMAPAWWWRWARRRLEHSFREVVAGV